MGSLYGHEVRSELPLRRLNGAPGTRGTLTVLAAGSDLREPDGEPASVVEGEDGRRHYASYETAEGCLLLLPPSGAFRLEPATSRITTRPGDGVDDLFEHRLVSTAVTTLLSMGDDLALHASAVAVDGRAVLFCGPTRRGKSTLIAALGRAGLRVMGEDGIAISWQAGAATAWPGARGVRIRPEHGGGESVLKPDPGPGEPPPGPVAAVVALGERGQSLAVERLEPSRALALLTPSLAHSGGRDAIAAAFARLARLLGTVPALRATLPDDLAALPEASKNLLDAALAGG